MPLTEHQSYEIKKIDDKIKYYKTLRERKIKNYVLINEHSQIRAQKTREAREYALSQNFHLLGNKHLSLDSSEVWCEVYYSKDGTWRYRRVHHSSTNIIVVYGKSEAKALIQMLKERHFK